MSSFNCIAPDVHLGKNIILHQFINLYGCSIGDQTKIGAFVEVQKGASIGKFCKISSHSFICEGVAIKDHVFIGHNVTFINDRFPDAKEKNWKLEKTHIEAGASIGSGVTILCGVTIGQGALVGAGSLVTQSIPPFEIWAGHPARFLRKK